MFTLIAATILAAGAVDPAVTSYRACHEPTKVRRHVTPATKRAVCRRAGLPSCAGYIVDHVVPLSLGGANSLDNLQPQRPAESHAKDLAENRMHRRLCEGEVTLKEAQAYFLRRAR
jgi:hypothetical protein